MVVSTGTHSQQFGGLSEGVCPVGHAAQRTFEQGPAPMAPCPAVLPVPLGLPLSIVPPVVPPMLPVDVSVVPVPVAVPVVPWSPVPPVAHAQSTSRPITIANFCNLLMGPPLVDSSTEHPMQQLMRKSFLNPRETCRRAAA
ncbi:MAG TPA: hypothetical protein VLQ45_11050 [Thermoanaerobaculia bacterium]|nr:hypothetical protein [Thermoanaerobaculia bacterium]